MHDRFRIRFIRFPPGNLGFMVVSSKQTRGVLTGRALRVVKKLLTDGAITGPSVLSSMSRMVGPPVSSRALCVGVCICEIVGVFCVCVFVCGRPFV